MAYLGTKPADAVITSDQIADGVITTADLANSAVTPAKLSATAQYIGYKNKLINGNFDFWQRGTSATYTTSVNTVADRWQYLTDGTLNTGTVISRQTFTNGQTDVPNEPTYFMQVAYTSVNTPSNYIRQRIENVSTLNGEVVTLSFWARVTSGTLACSAQFQQEFGTGGSPSAGIYGIGSTNFTFTTTWQQFTMTTTIPSISGKTLGSNNNSALNAAIIFPASGSATVQIAQCQVEVGSVATSFDTRPLGIELLMCQRYFQIYTQPLLRGVVPSAAQVGRMGMVLPVQMRATPTSTIGQFPLYDGFGTGNVSSVNVDYSDATLVEYDFQCTTSWSAAGRVALVYQDGTTSLQLNAEL